MILMLTFGALCMTLLTPTGILIPTIAYTKMGVADSSMLLAWVTILKL